MQQLTLDYEILEEIGRGKFGVVSRCMSHATSEIYAVKTIHKTSVLTDPIDSLSLMNEPKALTLLSLSQSFTSCDHDSDTLITRLHAAYDSPTHLHLVLDYCPFPTLYDVVKLRHCLSEHEAREICLSLVNAVQHCHENGVVHRDIKPENILVDPDTNRVKLCDFGSAGFIFGSEATMIGVVGTPYYVAPEVLEGRAYREKVDLWSVGVVLYIMLAGFPPFYGESVEEIFHKVSRANLRFPTRLFGKVSLSVKDLLRKILCKDVSRRFSADEILRHPWMTGGKNSATI